MIQRHEDSLAQRIDAVVGRGFTFIEWFELYAWYGMERITKTVWKDLDDRFNRAKEDPSHDLWAYETQNGILLVASDELKKVSERAN